MKKVITTAICALAFACASAAGNVEPGDSIECFSHPDSVAFVHGGNTIELKVFGTKDNPDYYYSYRRDVSGEGTEISKEGNSGWDFTLPFIDRTEKGEKRAAYSFECGGLGLGFVNAVNAPAAMNVNMASSYEVFIDHIVGISCRPWRNGTSFLLGFGFGWRNYRMTGTNRFVQENGFISLGGYEEGADVQFSRLKMFSLMFPIMFRQELGKGFDFSAGPVLNVNVHGSMKTKYKLGDDKIENSSDDIHQRKVTVDLMAQLNYKAIGFYVKYSPCKILDESYGPEFRHLSAGITLFY